MTKKDYRRRGTNNQRNRTNAEHPPLHRQVQQDRKKTPIQNRKQDRQQSQRPYLESKNSTREEEKQDRLKNSL